MQAEHLKAQIQVNLEEIVKLTKRKSALWKWTKQLIKQLESSTDS
jgi:hypothetical protein